MPGGRAGSTGTVSARAAVCALAGGPSKENRMSVYRIAALAAALVAGACPTEAGVVTASADIGVTLIQAPVGVDCIAFSLADADGTRQTYVFAAARAIRIANVTVGAYQLSAVAYASGQPAPVTDAQCATALPASAPWTTES